MIAGHCYLCKFFDWVLSRFDSRPADYPLTPDEVEHMKAIRLDPLSPVDVAWYNESHCLRSINPNAGRGGKEDRRIWQ